LLRPELTGLWQVNGKDNVSFKDLLLDPKLLAAPIPTKAGEFRKATRRRLGRT